VLIDSTPTTSATPAMPRTRPNVWRRSIRSDGSMNGANNATNSAAGEIRTAVRPDGTSC